MTINGFLSLAVQTVTAPRDVARLLLSLRLGPEALLTAFALVCVLNTLLYGVSLTLPLEQEAAVQLPLTAFLALQVLVLGGTILAFTWAGRMLGGVGEPVQMALLLIWMQGLRVLVQVVFVLVAPLAPALGGLLFFAASVLGVWIAVHFLDEVHGFDNLFRALMVLVLGVVGMAIALSVILALVGVSPNGTFSNV
jgi:hypothetical protein